MTYIPGNPQTNLFIDQYYQRLGYVYREELADINVYETNIETVDLGGEIGEVPSWLMPNKAIHFYDFSNSYSVIEAERLFAQYIIKNVIDYDWSAPVLTLNLLDYRDYVKPEGVREYPKIMTFEVQAVEGDLAYWGEYFRRVYSNSGLLYLGYLTIFPDTYQTSFITKTTNWDYDTGQLTFTWSITGHGGWTGTPYQRHVFLFHRFYKYISPQYRENQPIYDTRINILKDIEDLIEIYT
jgi:hypothetical protein